jgi:hypothetical protein
VRRLDSIDERLYGRATLPMFADDPVTGFSCIVNVSDLDPESDISNDTLALAEGMKGLREWVKKSSPELGDSISLDGSPGFSFRADTNGRMLRGRIYRRGTRIYTITVGGPATGAVAGGVDESLNSFRFLDLPPSQWRTVRLDTLGFSISVPTSPRITAPYYNEQGYQGREQVKAIDRGSGEYYMVERITFSEYYRADDSSALLRMRGYGENGREDSILSRKEIEVDGMKGEEIEFDRASSGWVSRVRLLLQGRHLYRLSAMLPMSSGTPENADRFFGSLRLVPDSAWSPFSSKIVRLLSDLESKDSARRFASHEALYWHLPARSDLPAIYRAIERPYDDDLDSTGSTRAGVIGMLARQNDSTTPTFLRGAYPLLPQDARRSTIRTLAEINTPGSLDLLADLLPKEPQLFPSDVDELNLFTPQLQEPASIGLLYPRILELMRREQYQRTLVRLTAKGLDSGIVDPALLVPYDSIFTAVAMRASERKRMEESDESYRNDEFLRIAIRSLESLPPGRESDSLLRVVMNDTANGNDLVIPAVAALLRHRRDVSPSLLKGIASSPSGRVALYRELQRIGNLDRFPAAYRSQRQIAEGLFEESLVDNGWGYQVRVPGKQEISLLAEREIEYEGRRGRVYLFRFCNKMDDAEFCVYGITGMQPLDRSQILLSSELSSGSPLETADVTVPASTDTGKLFDTLLERARNRNGAGGRARVVDR